jgi:hypothetical protein
VSPIVAALDHPEVTLSPDTVPAAALSLVDAFGEVPDPRKARGIRHGVAAILPSSAVPTPTKSDTAHGTRPSQPCSQVLLIEILR